MDKKRHQITVLLDHAEFERFKLFCEEQGYKKSTLIARLIRDYLNSKESFQKQTPQKGS